MHVMGIDGSKARLISGALDRDVGALRWDEESGGVYFTAGDPGTQNVHHVSTSGQHHQITSGMHMLSFTSMARGETAVGIRTSPHEPPDVVKYTMVDGATQTQLTAVNDDVLVNKRLGEVEEI